MKNFWLVYRTQLLSALGAGRAEKRKKGAAKAAKLSGYLLLWVLVAALAGLYEFLYATSFAAFGQVDSFPALIVFASSALTLFTSISYTKSLIFSSKDHDLLFALPIKSSTVIAAKLVTIYTLDLAVSLAILVPCGVIYGIFAAPSALTLVRYFVLALLSPMLPMLIAAMISAVVSLIASRFRFAKMVGTFIYVALFAAYMIGVMTISSSTSDEDAYNIFIRLTASLRGIYPPLEWFEKGFLGDIPSALLFVGVSAAAFLLIIFVFGKFYGKIHGAFALFVYRGEYKVSENSVAPTRALLGKEGKRFLSSPGVMINQAAGLVAVVLFTGIMIYKTLTDNGGEDAAVLSMVLGTMAPYFFAMFTAMSSLTAASISLEGKNLWILKSLPISALDILKTKLRLHLIVCCSVPALCCVVLSFVLGLTLLQAVVLICTPLVFAYNAGAMGLLLNLKKPKLDWVNEMMVAKQSMPVTVTLFSGMIAALLPMVGSIVLLVVFGENTLYPLLQFALGATVILLGVLLGIILTHLLKKHGDGMFRKLGE